VAEAAISGRSFHGMAREAQRLPVVLIPEQYQVSAMRDAMVNAFGSG
jgi:hypothetical protein